jgi:hypothetical protein
MIFVIATCWIVGRSGPILQWIYSCVIFFNQLESLNADKHVFCEKPIGHDIKTVDSVYALAKEKNKYMLTGMCCVLSSLNEFICRISTPFRPAFQQIEECSSIRRTWKNSQGAVDFPWQSGSFCWIPEDLRRNYSRLCLVWSHSPLSSFESNFEARSWPGLLDAEHVP